MAGAVIGAEGCTFVMQVVLGRSVDSNEWSCDTLTGSLVVPKMGCAPVTVRVSFDNPSCLGVDGINRPGFHAVGDSDVCSAAEPIYIKMISNQTLDHDVYLIGMRITFTPSNRFPVTKKGKDMGLNRTTYK